MSAQRFKGFTLIELMVVIAIIAILTSIGYSVYSGAQKSALDSRRKADIDAIAKAYEANYNPTKNKYTSLTKADFVNEKIPVPPEDPNGFYQGFNGGFPAPATGQTTSQATSFLICAKLGNASADTICSSTNANCYCKSPSQGKPVASSVTPTTAPTGLPGFPTPTPITPVTYSQSFTSGIGSSGAQCTAWNSFRAAISATTTYSRITISGSNNTTGVSCTGATANTICQSLRTGITLNSTACDSRNWAVGTCVSSIELSANGAICSCPSPGYISRPCIGGTNPNWGGINSATCSGPTQTIIVTCQ